MGAGPSKETDGEIDFSPDELAEMRVEVAGQSSARDDAAGRRKKRALRIPADEVVRVGNAVTLPLITEHEIAPAPTSSAELADELVDHAFLNGGRAEGEVRAARSFVVAKDVTAEIASFDDVDEPELSLEAGDDALPTPTHLSPNLRALVRALAPTSTSTSAEFEQLDSDELQVMDVNEAIVPRPAPESDPGEASPELLDSDEALEATDDAPDDTLDIAIDDRPRRATLPPATPVAAAARTRLRSITPVMPVGGPASGVSPAVAPLAPPPPPQGDGEGLRPRRKRRAKQWFEEIFDDDYLRTLPYLSARQTEREAQFITESLELKPGSAVLDLACGYGRHAMELAARGSKVTGLDLSLPLLIRAADAARRMGVAVNFVHGDMREMTFDAEFDGAYCVFTSFGYFDDDTNRKVAANLQRAIRPGGRVLIELINRDYITRDLPTRVWWQGEGCVVLEEVDFNYFSSRLQVQRSIILEDGRQLEQEISIRAYSLHEIGKVLHHAGFRVIEVSGGLGLRGKFFGAHSRQLLVLAEKKP